MPDHLLDSYNRAIEYLRVSITDLCNLRCIYCRPPEGLELISHDEILRYEEILTIIDVFRDLGVRKIRITGGEPLVRRGVLEFLSRLAEMDGIEDVGLTTNGVRLASMAKDLKAAGLTRVNISLDSMRHGNFQSHHWRRQARRCAGRHKGRSGGWVQASENQCGSVGRHKRARCRGICASNH